MLRNLLLLLLVAITLSSCAEGWTNEYKDSFRQSCKEGANVSGLTQAQKEHYCDCTLDKTMQHYKTITEVVENKDSTQMSAAVEECKVDALKW